MNIRERLRALSTLQMALILSVAAHAGLLAIRFAGPQAFARVFEDMPLDVVLVNTQSSGKPDKPQAIAQASHAGGGDAQPHRIAASPLPFSARVSEGNDIENADLSYEEIIKEQQQMLASLRKTVAKIPKPDPRKSSQMTEAEKAREEKRQQLLDTIAAIERKIDVQNSRPRKKFASPATIGKTYAVYYDAMREKIEKRGTDNFPVHQGKKLFGDLLMSITINHDGSVLDAHVDRSSGIPMLDNRARAIAQSAGPFGRFTAAMRAQADQFVIVSLFRFTQDKGFQAQFTENQMLDSSAP